MCARTFTTFIKRFSGDLQDKEAADFYINNSYGYACIFTTLLGKSTVDNEQYVTSEF